MRIVCQQCSAAYAIDDKVITPRGVRAQCPRCRHLQLVRRVEGAGPAVAPPAARPQGRAAGPSGRQAPSGGSGHGPTSALEALHSFADEGENTAPMTRPPPAPPGGGAGVSLGQVGGGPAALPACSTCGAPLADAFERALGMCEACRQAQARGVPPQVAGRPAPSAPVAVDVDAAAPVPRAAPPLPQARAERLYAEAPRSRLWPMVALGAVVGALAAGGGLLLWRRTAVGTRAEVAGAKVPGAEVARPPAPPPVAPAVQAAVARWRPALAELSGSAQELVALGQEQLAEGTHTGALRAEARFQRALVLEPQNDAALAGYLQALAHARAARVEEPVFREALALAEVGLERSGRAPAMLVGTASLLLARPAPEEVRARVRELATEALGAKDPGLRAEAHLVLARVQLADSLALAAEHLAQAEALRPQLGRALPVRALALEYEGRYEPAMELLRRRVAQDAEDGEALAALARLHQELGQGAQARAAYQAQRRSGGPGVERALAVLLYQGEGARPAEAVRMLRSLLKDREGLGPGDVAELLVHLAGAERAAGNPAAARRAAEEALAVAPRDAGAHLQLLVLALERRDGAGAARHLQGVQGRLGDAGLEALLEGRVRFLEGRPEQAMERFLEAVARDGRRLDGQLWAGAAAAAAGRPADAFRLLLVAQGMDPVRLAPPTGSPRLFLRPRETLRGAEGHVLRLARGADVVPARLYEALIRFHQGELGTADRLARAVTDADVDNAAALALRARVALARGERRAALRLGAQAARSGRQLALARYAHAEGLAASGDRAGALAAMREALALAPGLPTLAVRLAELEADTGARDAARERLLKVVARDRSDAAAKRALYAIDRRG